MQKTMLIIFLLIFSLPLTVFSATEYNLVSFSSSNLVYDTHDHQIMAVDLDNNNENTYLLVPKTKNTQDLILKNKNNQIIWQTKPYELFRGEVFATLGNKNSEKIIITAPGAEAGPEVRIFDTQGNLEGRFFAFDKNFRGGLRITVADIDNDNIDEIICAKGISGEPEVRIYNLYGSLIKSFLAYSNNFTGGFDVVAADVNGDGQIEIVTAAGFGGGPHVRIFNSKGNVLYQFFAYDKNFTGGVNVMAVDEKNDGKAEIFTLPQRGGGPHLRVFDYLGNVKYQSFCLPENTREQFYFSYDYINNDLIIDSGPKISKTEITVPFYRQEKNLSCEAASLRMLLASKGVYLTEEQILQKIPQAYPLEYKNGVWADPNEGFVGDINGSQYRKTGYGVYWEPINNAAKHWVQTDDFSNWTFNKLIEQLLINNAVVIWGSFDSNPRDISWRTPDNRYIKAYTGEHTFVVTGFEGNPLNPSSIITLDSLSGRRVFSKQSFLNNWRLFNNSGVQIK